MINVKWLLALRAVVNARTVTEAASRLCITQPAVSRIIGHLEEELGFPLFSRSGGRLTITSQGEAFYQEAERALAGLDGLAWVGRNIQRGSREHLRIFAMSPLVGTVIPNALARLLKDFPTLNVALEVRNRREVEQWIPQSQFDLGLVILPIAVQTSRDSAPLVRAPIMVVMHENHPLARHDRIDLPLLAQQQLIMMPRNSLLRRWIDGRFAEIGAAPAPRIEASTMASGCVLAAKGLGVTIADAFTIETADLDGLAVRPLDPPLDATFGYVLPTQRQPSALILRFLELVRESAADALAGAAFLKQRRKTKRRAGHAEK